MSTDTSTLRLGKWPIAPPPSRPQDRDTQLAAIGQGVAAAVTCQHLGITRPVDELPLLIQIAECAERLRVASIDAVNGTDIPAWISADNRMRELQAQRVALRACTHAEHPADTVRSQPPADPA